MKPQVEVVKVNIKSQLLQNSGNSINSVDSGGLFESTISGGSGGGRSRGYDDDDWDE